MNKEKRSDDYMVMEGRRYLNARQACELLGIARTTFYKRGYGTQLKAYHFRGYSRVFYALDEVQAFASKM